MLTPTQMDLCLLMKLDLEPSLYRTSVSISVVLVMLGQDYCLNSGQECMDSMKSWADIEEGKAGRSVCCEMQSVVRCRV